MNMKKGVKTMDNLISRQDAIETIRKLQNAGMHWFVSAEAVFDALLKLPSVQPESQWIPVSERIPEWRESVLTYIENGDMKINFVIDEEDKEWFYDGVIAWMYLPEPYKESKDVSDD